MGTVQPVLAWIKMDVKPLMMMMMMFHSEEYSFDLVRPSYGIKSVWYNMPIRGTCVATKHPR